MSGPMGSHTPFGTCFGIFRFGRFRACWAVGAGSESRTGPISFTAYRCHIPGTMISSMMARCSVVPILSPVGTNEGGVTRRSPVIASNTITGARCLFPSTRGTSAGLVAMICEFWRLTTSSTVKLNENTKIVTRHPGLLWWLNSTSVSFIRISFAFLVGRFPFLLT